MRRAAVVLAMVLCGGVGCGDDDEQATGPAAPQGANAPPAEAQPTAPPGPDVCTGSDHTCVLKPSGEVLCAGENVEGELGDGTTQDRWTWTPVVGLDDARDIECGARHTCALRSNGEVSCWGRNRQGELGAGNTDVHLTPVAVQGLSNVTELSAGLATTCARLGDGAVKCWGENGNRILAQRTSEDSATPLAIDGLTDVAEITVGTTHACARKNDGTVWCWGSNGEHQLAQPGDGMRYSEGPVQVAGLAGVTHVAAGGRHSCAVSPQGVSCWGNNDNAQSGGEPVGEDIETPKVIAGLEGTERLALGVKRTCALLGTGGVKCWGYNNYTAGLLGIGPTRGVRDAVEPTELPGVSGAEHIDTSDDHTCVVGGDGKLTCWGVAGDGRMGNGEPRTLSNPTELAPSIADMSGTASSLPTFEPADGELTVSPHLALGRGQVCGVKPDGHVYCFGEGSDGRLGNGSGRPNSSSGGADVVGISDAVQVSAGIQRVCALRRNGEVACWGDMMPRLRSSHPLPTDLGEPVKQISVGGTADEMILCGVHQDGTVSCVGRNHGGELGRGERGQGTLEPAKVAGLSDVEEVHVALTSVCARQSSGKVMCWGSGRKGQLGNGAEESSLEPVEVTGLRDAVALGGGHYNHCAVRRAGAYVCWGDNDDGQLATGQTGDEAASSRPVPVRGVSGVRAAGQTTDSMCVVTRGGPRCWGANDFGQTGTGDAETDDVTSPVTYGTDDEAVAALGDVIHMGCGSSFCCALHAEGGVSCAGSTPIGGSGGLMGLSNRRSATPIVAEGVAFAVPAGGSAE